MAADGRGTFCGPDGYPRGIGWDAWSPANEKLGSSGQPFPSKYAGATWPISLMALMGAFADANGVVIGAPFKVGHGITEMLVPAGASFLQLGINDDIFADNQGSFSVRVTGGPISFKRLSQPDDVLNLDAGIDDALIPTTQRDRLLALPVVDSGLVADGVTPLVIRIIGPPGATVTLSYENEEGGTLLQPPPLQMPVIRSLGATDWDLSRVIQLDSSGIGFAMISALQPSALSMFLGSKEITADLVAVVDGQAGELARARISFRKPPIVFVHGVASNADTWSESFLLKFSEQGRDFVAIDYGNPDVRDGEKWLRAIRQSLANLAEDVDATLDNAVFGDAGLAPSMKWAMTRFDVVGHSQGGVILRMLSIARNSSKYWGLQKPFRNATNFERGRFRRIVTIGSPHNGNVLDPYMHELGLKGTEALPQAYRYVVQKQISDLWNQGVLGKFDPFGVQVRHINRPEYITDPDAPLHLSATYVNDGFSPNEGPGIRAYNALGLRSLRGTMLLPHGSDGVVEPDSSLAGAFPGNRSALKWRVEDAQHAGPGLAFGIGSQLPDSQTRNANLARYVATLLEGDRLPFGPFLRQDLRPMTDANWVRSLVPSVEAAPGPIAPGSGSPQAPQKLGLAASQTTSEFHLAVDESQIEMGSLNWSLGIFGTSAEPVSLQISETDARQVTLVVADDFLGEVVLSATYISTAGVFVVAAPIVAVSRPPPVVQEGISVDPDTITIAAGTSTTFGVRKVYSDLTQLPAYVSPGANLSVVSSRTTVVRVDGGLNITALTPGTARLTISLDGFQTRVNVESRGVPPLAANDNALTNGKLPLTIPILANDVALSGGTLSIDSVSQPLGGTATIDGNSIIYTAGTPAMLAGSDRFTYRVIDSWGVLNEATVAVTVVDGLDRSFGSGGKATTPIGQSGGNGLDVALQSDGKIVVAGYVMNGTDFIVNYDIGMVRYNANGTLDTTFGTGGTVMTDFDLNDESGNSVVVQSDGKIVVAGYSSDENSSDFAVVRYTASGALDTTFGVEGKVTTDFYGSWDEGYSVALQSDGKIVVAGACENGSDWEFALARYNIDGTLDPTFGTGGKVTTPLGSSGYAWAYSVAVQTDGKIVIAGESDNGTNIDIAVVRYTASGALDPTFGTGGKVVTDFDLDESGNSVVVQSDGKILVAGYSSNDDFAVVRFTSSGALDTAFGTNGRIITDFDGSSDYASSVALQANGKIFVAGSTSKLGSSDFAVARYTTSGVLDNSFGEAGKVSTDFGGAQDFGSSVAVQHDGMLVVAGRSGNSFAVVRYEGETAPEVALSGNGTNIANGETTPSAANHTDFGSTAVSGGTVARTFTVTNSGTGILQLTGSAPNYVTLSGSSAFSVTAQPAAAVAASGGTATFTITFNPSAAGPATATVSIASDDSDENPFTYVIAGIGLTAQESWRQTYFGTTGDGGNAGDDFDFDRDGLVNLIEWACHLDPTTSTPLPTSVMRNGANLEFTYTRSIAAVSAGATFIVEWSNTLPGPDLWITSGVTEQVLSDNGTVQVVKATLPVGSAVQCFVRLKIFSPP